MIRIFKGYTDHDILCSYKWDLTIGKSYEVIESYIVDCFLIKDDRGKQSWYHVRNFYTLEEFREIQIENIL
jgi:hypothetical protein